MPNEHTLIINKQQIHKLNGVASVTILKPNNKKLPIILLFGNIHTNEGEHICQLDDVSCFNIGDDKFIILFDELSKKYTVYIFIESFIPNNIPVYSDNSHIDTTSSYNYASGTQFDILTNIGIRHLIKDTNKFKNINWQFGDARQQYSFIEGKIDLFCELFNNFYYFIEKQLGVESILEKELIEVKEKNNNIINLLINDIIKLKKLWTSLIDTTGVNINNFAIEMTNLILTSNGLIKQELDKLSTLTPELKNLKNLIYQTLTDNFKNRNFHNYIPFPDYFHKNINDLISIIFDNKLELFRRLSLNIYDYNYFLNLILCMVNPIIELYFILKTMNNPINENKPNLSICFFGNNHVINIEKQLTKFTKYYSAKHIIKKQFIKNTEIINQSNIVSEDYNLDEILQNKYLKYKYKYLIAKLMF